VNTNSNDAFFHRRVFFYTAIDTFGRDPTLANQTSRGDCLPVRRNSHVVSERLVPFRHAARASGATDLSHRGLTRGSRHASVGHDGGRPPDQPRQGAQVSTCVPARRPSRIARRAFGTLRDASRPPGRRKMASASRRSRDYRPAGTAPVATPRAHRELGPHPPRSLRAPSRD
jgi:hypothetical protein